MCRLPAVPFGSPTMKLAGVAGPSWRIFGSRTALDFQEPEPPSTSMWRFGSRLTLRDLILSRDKRKCCDSKMLSSNFFARYSFRRSLSSQCAEPYSVPRYLLALADRAVLCVSMSANMPKRPAAPSASEKSVPPDMKNGFSRIDGNIAFTESWMPVSEAPYWA